MWVNGTCVPFVRTPQVPKGSLWNLQLQPFAQVMMIYPARESDASQTSPPRNLLAGAWGIPSLTAYLLLLILPLSACSFSASDYKTRTHPSLSSI